MDDTTFVAFGGVSTETTCCRYVNWEDYISSVYAHFYFVVEHSNAYLSKQIFFLSIRLLLIE